MVKSYKRLMLSTLILIAPLMVACESADQISGVADIQASINGQGGAKRQVQLVTGSSVNSSATDAQLVLPGTGGVVSVGKFRLVVPRGAVQSATIFTMKASEGDLIKVSLTAKTVQGEPVTTFKKPLKLTMPYGNVSDEFLSAPGNWLIANISENGLNEILEVVNVSVNREEQTITGSITHFSDYALAKEIIVIVD